MTLVVEDGTGLSNADSYISVADANTYFTSYGVDSWADAEDTKKEAALKEATRFLDKTYRWIGYILSTSQSLGWPRTDAEDLEGRSLEYMVPSLIKDATCELALSALSSRLLSDKTNANFVTREKVGEIEVEYASGAPSGTQFTYPDRLLDGLYTSKAGSNNIKLDRV